MVADRVALGQSPPGQRRMGIGVAAEQEEGCPHAFGLESVQHLRRRRRPGAVVEGQHQFLVGKRQCVGEMFAADPRRGRGAHRKDAGGPQRIGAATAGVGGAGRGRDDDRHESDQRGDETVHWRRSDRTSLGDKARRGSLRFAIAQSGKASLQARDAVVATLLGGAKRHKAFARLSYGGSPIPRTGLGKREQP